MPTKSDRGDGFHLSKTAIFWCCAMFFTLLFFWVFSPILLPFIAGAVLAYLLDPVADRLEAWGLSRLLATLTILICFGFFVVVALLIIVPNVFAQLSSFIEYLPELGQVLRDKLTAFQQWAQTSENALVKRIFAESKASFSSSTPDLLANATSYATKLLSGVVTSSSALFNSISLIVVTPVVAFYLLYDWDRMVADIDELLPRAHADNIRALSSDMSTTISAFIRGQGSVCLILGVFYAVGLSIIGLNFGLVIGLIAGIISFIPFVGTIVGLILGLGVALVQFWPDFIMISLVAIVFGLGQFLEGNILQPKLIGDSVGLHPVWLMFALFAFSLLLGFLGLLIAVPAAACIGVLARFALSRYKQSELYLAAPQKTK